MKRIATTWLAVLLLAGIGAMAGSIAVAYLPSHFEQGFDHPR